MTNIEENWDYSVDLRSDSLRDFLSGINNVGDEMLKLDSFKIQCYDDNGQSHDNELKILIEKNKQLREEIDSKVDQLAKQKIQYESYKQDQKLLSQEIKDTHEAFLMAKKFYKKYLKLYYTVESRAENKQTVFVQFFTEAKKESENFSARFLRDTKSDYYTLLETKPKIEEIKKVLLETNDLPAVLCCIRQAFLKLKSCKK